MIPDHLARQTALDTQQSFIVQAPAGSGKTELLVQRFLALLQVVQVPEEMIAITFTKKAAAEMRQRILEALHVAEQAAPKEAHAFKTWELARAALQRDQQLQWHLFENPHRLRVQTIDSLCHTIAHQAPLLSGLGIANTLEKGADAYYLQAARRLLSTLEEASPLADYLAILLLHLDNRIEMVETLLVGMLKRRDQWLPYLISQGKSLTSDAFRQMLEKNLGQVVGDILVQCAAALPAVHQQELMTLIPFAAKNLAIENILPLPEAIPENLSHWLFLAKMLLTNEGTWRLKIDKRQGFPAAEKDMKGRIQGLLQQLPAEEIWRQHLAALLNAPPICYTESQWQIVGALSMLLPLLVAELKVLFKENSVADFSEVAMAANAVLGDKENPTDLTLLLDAKIHHLLVDEFQDTATTQFRLLEKLTWDWQPGDGRTLFLVGDPMQSIYRFREAEVGLFLKAQQEGLGGVSLKPLQLAANFRSTPALVAWINEKFAHIFPSQSDISLGAVRFSPCVATQNHNPSSAVFLECFLKGQTFAATQKIVEIAKQKAPEQTMAILVRARSHLYEIIPALKKANLNFSAIEIDPLHQQAVVKDLLSLTGALLHVADRLAWLSLLRAPWCGLTLDDLHAVAGKNFHQPVWETLAELESITNLSAEGRVRLNSLVAVLQHSLAQRGRLSFRSWIEETWLALKGPLCVTSEAALSSAQAYFKLLDTFDQAGSLPNIEKLQQMVETQYATPLPGIDCRIHVMTVHKAKGLEFDTVIVPYLERTSRSDDNQLLLWLDRPRIGHANELILAPIKAKSQDEDLIYTWLRQIEKTKSQHELARLLYVAATRAKKNLYLMAMLSVKEDDFEKPEAGSFLSLVWNFLEKPLEKIAIEKTAPMLNSLAQDAEPTTASVYRLTIEQYAANSAANPVGWAERPNNLKSSRNSDNKIEPFDPTHGAQRTGTIIHRVLQQISQEGLAAWTTQKIDQEKARWKIWLAQAGLAEGLAVIYSAVFNTLNDPRGRWILADHAIHHSEYALTGVIDKVPMQFMIDRTFIDETQTRWIIDYKTAVLATGQDRNFFLAQAQSLHREQLENYACIMRELDNRPIRLGIYFPAFGGWCEWAYTK
jgi:ATP-dependent helicase/nuclease subunit A